MSDQNVFDDTKPNTEETPEVNENNNNTTENTTVDLFVNKLLEITREDGTPKYETVTDALDALKHSQEHIRKLEEERKTEREKFQELEAKAQENINLRETIERLSKPKMTEERPNQNTPDNGGFSEEKVVELFEKVQAKKERENTLSSNLKLVSDTLASKYGDKAKELIKTKAEELGMSLEEMKAFSAEKPKAALALFGEAPKKSPTPSSSSHYIPPTPASEELAKPEKSLISGAGATDKNRIDYIRKIKEKVAKEHGITF